MKLHPGLNLPLLASALISLAAGLHAQSIPTLFNTGTDSAGNLLDPAQVDPHYALLVSPDKAAPGPAAYTLSPGYPVGPWMEEGPASRWIAPRAGDGANSTPGVYLYRTLFDLTGFDPASVTIDGAWAMDDGANNLLLNGVPLNKTASGFDAFKFFSINSGFIAGVNTLDFEINNGGATANPTGLRVEFFSSATPIAPDTPVSIVTPPTNQTVRATATVTLKIVANGSWPVSYQWKRGTEILTNGTNAILWFQNIRTNDAGDYTVTLSNAVNSVTTQSVRLTVLNEYDFDVGRFAGVSLRGTPGNAYRLQSSDNLRGADWQTTSNLVLIATPTLIIDMTSQAASNRFYRAVSP